MTFDNFLIRLVCKEDATKYHTFVDRNKIRLVKNFPKTVAASVDVVSTNVHLNERIVLANKKEFFTYVISDNLLDKIIGTVFIKNIDWSIPKGELGFFVDKDYEGKGIITKSVSMIINHCFSDMGLNKVYIRTAEDNFSSRRVAEKNNFQIEGILRKDFKTGDGTLIDLIYYGLLK